MGIWMNLGHLSTVLLLIKAALHGLVDLRRLLHIIGHEDLILMPVVMGGHPFEPAFGGWQKNTSKVVSEC